MDQITLYRRTTALCKPEDHLLIEANPATASRVAGSMWVGSAPPIGPRLSRIFDCLVLAAVEYQPSPECFGDMEVVGVGLDDSGSLMTLSEMRDAVRAAGRVARWLSGGKKVLVTCHMGLNRSGLIAALAMCCGPSRTPVDEAIAAVRAARGPRALSNKCFVRFLHAYGGRFRRPAPPAL